MQIMEPDTIDVAGLDCSGRCAVLKGWVPDTRRLG